MTTNSIKTGTFPVGGTRKYHYAKSWTGGDGKTITNQHEKIQQWNAYRMSMSKFLSSQPNEIGTISDLGIYTKRTNHSWNTGGGSDPLALGYATFGDGSISNTFPNSQFNLVWTNMEELELLQKMLKKVKGHTYDIGVALAEVDKLAGTVLGTIKNLCYGVDDLRKLRFAQFARRFGAKPPRRRANESLVLKDVSGRFLEMRYAWGPAIADAYEAAKAFEAISNGPRRQRFRASRMKTRTADLHTNYGVVQQTVEAKKSYLYEMYEEMDVARQLGLFHPGGVLWERLPWSFVIDWFIPIGTYLSLIGQVPGMKGRWCVSRTLRHTSSGIITQSPEPWAWTIASPFPNHNMERFSYERTIQSFPPNVPHPKFRVAGAIQGKRIANAIALAHQKFFR